MLPNPSSAKDTSHTRLVRPRRRYESVRQRDPELLQKMLGDSLAVSADLHCLDSVAPTTDGGPVGFASSNMNRSEHVPAAEHRIDAAHGSLPKRRPRSMQAGPDAVQDDSVVPRRRPSLRSLLLSDTSQGRTQVEQGHTQLETGMSEEYRHDLYETLIACDVGVFQDAGFSKDAGLTHAESQEVATGMVVSPSNDGIGSQQVDADDWLSLHAADLIRRIQDWADELSARESQLTTRMSQQLQRERRFRALCETSVAQVKENARPRR